MLHVSSLNIQVLLSRPDFSPKLRELTLYSMSGINTHIFIYIYIYPLDPSTTPEDTQHITNGLKTHEVVKMSIKLVTRYRHDKSSTKLPWQIQYKVKGVKPTFIWYHQNSIKMLCIAIIIINIIIIIIISDVLLARRSKELERQNSFKLSAAASFIIWGTNWCIHRVFRFSYVLL